MTSDIKPASRPGRLELLQALQIHGSFEKALDDLGVAKGSRIKSLVRELRSDGLLAYMGPRNRLVLTEDGERFLQEHREVGL